MQNKILSVLFMLFLCVPIARAEDAIDPEIDDLSAEAVSEYQVEGSLFQQITDLEQEKILMQLEKERAQLDLELDRLAAEKIKLHMEIDTLSGRAEQQQQQIETEKAKLEAEAARLALEKEQILATEVKPMTVTQSANNSYTYEQSAPVVADVNLSEKYRLVNVVGAGNQLQATLQDLSSGQNKRVSVGKDLDGFTVKSISVSDGVVFEKDGVTQNLNVGSSR